MVPPADYLAGGDFDGDDALVLAHEEMVKSFQATPKDGIPGLGGLFVSSFCVCFFFFNVVLHISLKDFFWGGCAWGDFLFH